MSTIKNTLIIIIFINTLIFVECEKPYNIPYPQIDALDILEPVNKDIIADIYIDATLSMEGFVASGASSRFATILQAIEGALIGGWSNSKIRFYQFGSQIISLPERGYLKAQNRDFYQNQEINKTTNIQNVIERATYSGLSIIVSDLYQDYADINFLLAKLKEKCIKNNIAIGILGIKGQFDGIIYDIGINKLAIKYKSTENDIETYRPFYIIILGKHAGIDHFYRHLIQAAPSIDLSNFIIFSRYIVNPMTTLAMSKIDSITNLIEMPSLSSTDIYDSRFRKFRLASKSYPASFSITSNCNILPFTVPFDKTQIDISKSCKLCLRDSMLNANIAEHIIDIRLKNWENNFQSLIFEFEDFSTLPSGIYLYEVILRPRPLSYRLPQWIHEWNMDLETIDLIQRNPEIFNGATTLNLERFISDLWRINLENHNPKIAILHFFLKKD